MEAQEPVDTHAKSNRARFQKIFDAVADSLQVVVLLAFGCVLRGILMGLLRPALRVEWQDVDGGGAEHCELQVVRDDPRIVFR